MSKRLLAGALFLAIAAVAPIRSYDFFWHLATGRWIAEHHALPTIDPFALASAKTPWINGEWLWELGAYGVHLIGGERGMSTAQALFVAAIFLIAFLFAARDHDIGVALLVSAIAFAGASDRLGVRPAAAAAMLIAIAVGLHGSRLPVPKLAIAYALVTIVWINTHPSALLAPILAAATLLIDWRRWPVAIASGVALLVNPFGWNALIAPFRLSAELASGAFVNAEWLPTAFENFPLIYLVIAAMVVAYLAAEKRPNLWRIVIFAMLAYLSIRYVRNHALFFAALPMLVPVTTRKLARNTTWTLAACAVFPIGWAMTHTDHAIGADEEYYPVRAVARLKSLALPGNIYNVDQFGGYLEWSFYPQRRALTDGRNELYAAFLDEDDKARHDSRVWHDLLDKYAIDLAVDEYAAPIEVVDVSSQQKHTMPASLARYHRRDWALIAFDDVAMIFARRSKFPAELLDRIEYVYLVPDAPNIPYATEPYRQAALREIERAKRELGASRVIAMMEEGAKQQGSR